MITLGLDVALVITLDGDVTLVITDVWTGRRCDTDDYIGR